jgi:aspartyl/asparaginyl beta-hydroxylase (cupin superfamily)
LNSSERILDVETCRNRRKKVTYVVYRKTERRKTRTIQKQEQKERVNYNHVMIVVSSILKLLYVYRISTR